MMRLTSKKACYIIPNSCRNLVGFHYNELVRAWKKRQLALFSFSILIALALSSGWENRLRLVAYFQPSLPGSIGIKGRASIYLS